jgi:hypothetical protein
VHEDWVEEDALTSEVTLCAFDPVQFNVTVVGGSTGVKVHTGQVHRTVSKLQSRSRTTALTSPYHLLTVWNPSYTDDALDEHLSILLHWDRERLEGRAAAEDVYVWWAKIRSKNRDGLLRHHADVVALDEQVQAEQETHLYLTDYRSLYVAEVGEITDDDVRVDEGEFAHMPGYYRGHPVDFWFRLFDVRRIVTGDTLEVINELKKLRNRGYHDRPVSLYGGMVDLPLIVRGEPSSSWFSDTDALNDGALWAQRAAEQRSEAQRMATELRDNLFGRELWPLLSPTTRSFLAAAEAEFRAHRDDAGFDLSGAAIAYAKAVETELNATVFPALRAQFRSKPPHEREVREEGRLLDLGGTVPHQSLGTVVHLLEHQDLVQAAVRRAMPVDHNWLLGLLPRELGPIRDLRNPGAHSEATSASALEASRRTILGIGCEGLLERLVRARLRSRD